MNGTKAAFTERVSSDELPVIIPAVFEVCPAPVAKELPRPPPAV